MNSEISIILNAVFLFLNVNECIAFPLSNWQGVGPVWGISVAFAFNYLSEHSQSHAGLILHIA